MDILFMMLGASCIFVFRRRKVDAPIKAWGYPILPALYVLITGIFVVNTAISLPSESWAGLIILLGGIPVYYWFKGRDY
jgi:APA family basic amino acid/polyamine antiporter